MHKQCDCYERNEQTHVSGVREMDEMEGIDTGGQSINSREKGVKGERLERLEPICATADSVRRVT